MARPRIAVLMAAYNAEDTIKPAMDSVLASTVPLDLYIIDDGSTLPVTEALGDVEDNVFIHRLAENGGLPKALNAGRSRGSRPVPQKCARPMCQSPTT